jgi:hypothetical protein
VSSGLNSTSGRSTEVKKPLKATPAMKTGGGKRASRDKQLEEHIALNQCKTPQRRKQVR